MKNSLWLFILLLLAFLFKTGNEEDVFICARSFIDSTWIQNDWYLEQNISYRYLFNLIAGSSYILFGYFFSLVGLKFLYLLAWAFVFEAIRKRININFVLYSMIIPWTVLNTSIVAGEWIFGGVDTKGLSYLCCFLVFLFIDKHTNLQHFYLVSLPAFIS